jgi:hypothetical protein
VHEDIRAAIVRLNEAEAFGGVKPLYSTSVHNDFLSKQSLWFPRCLAGLDRLFERKSNGSISSGTTSQALVDKQYVSSIFSFAIPISFFLSFCCLGRINSLSRNRPRVRWTKFRPPA